MAYGIDEEMNRVIMTLESVDPSSENYTTSVKNLEILSKVKAVRKPLFSWDTVILAATGVAQMLILLNYEKLDVVASKAISYVWKPK